MLIILITKKIIMKKILLSFVLSFILIGNTFAHPWRVDSSWGHQCKTNCLEYWLESWEYHYHKKVNWEYDYTQSISKKEYEENILIEKNNIKREDFKKKFLAKLSNNLEKMPQNKLINLNSKINSVLENKLSDNLRIQLEALNEVVELYIK